MEKFISMSVRLPVEIHQKFKIMSALASKPMNELIIAWVKSQKIKIPEYIDGGSGPKGQKGGSSVARTENEEKLKGMILDLKAEGISYQGIADKLEAKGVPTVSGRGSWNKGSISNLLKKWGLKDEGKVL